MSQIYNRIYVYTGQDKILYYLHFTLSQFYLFIHVIIYYKQTVIEKYFHNILVFTRTKEPYQYVAGHLIVKSDITNGIGIRDYQPCKSHRHTYR